MANQRQMRTLIYKRTHEGDPDKETGVFGNNKCMGRVRSWDFDAVIGVGGIGRKAKDKGIAGKLTWIGIGRRNKDKEKIGDDGYPLVTFDHFQYFGEPRPLLAEKASALARRMYDKKVRVLMDSLSREEQLDVEKILDLARDAPPSGQFEGAPQRNSQKTSGKCR